VQAIKDLFEQNWVTGNLSIAGLVAALSWLVIAVASATALRRAGADEVTVALTAASLLFAVHPPPTGTLGLLALLAAAYRWTGGRALRPRQQSTPATLSER
jgi:ABC-type transporter Mla maintaining outer membrane lipid asymmetry permease subunit MlaE